MSSILAPFQTTLPDPVINTHLHDLYRQRAPSSHKRPTVANRFNIEITAITFYFLVCLNYDQYIYTLQSSLANGGANV